MKLGVIGGTGKLGRGLALRGLEAGHEVIIGSRDPRRAETVARDLDPGIEAAGNRAAAEAAEAAILSVPYAAHRSTIEMLGPSLDGKLLIDATVPMDPESVSGVRTETGLSAAEEAQRWLGVSVPVYAAFQTISYHSLRDGSTDTDILVAGPDERKADALGLVASFGFRAVDAGPLASARRLEQLTVLLIAVNRRNGIKNAGIRILGLGE